MNIDTRTIRRVRDALVEAGRLDEVGEPGIGAPGDRGRDASLERVAPFVETMYLVMMADGRDHEHEIAAVRGATRALTHGLLDDTALEALLRRCGLLLREQGAQSRLQAIGSRICADRLDRETAFTLAAAVALADEDVAAEESTLLSSVAEWFGLSSRRSKAILQQFDEHG